MKPKNFVLSLGAVAALAMAFGPTPDSLLAEPGTLGSRKLGRTQKIKRWGYSLRVPKEWLSVPQEPGETRVVGSWKPDQEIVERKWDEASMGCELRIVRFPVKATTTEAKKDDKAEKKDKKKERERNRRISKFFGAKNAKTLDEFIEQEYEGAKKRYVPRKLKIGSGSSRLTGSSMEFTSGRSFVCAARFREANIEWGIFYEAPEEHYQKEWKKLFLQSIKTFRLFEPEGLPTTVAPGVAKKDMTPEMRREAIKNQIAGNPGWWALDTKNYVFLTNSKNKGFIKQLGREIETMRAKVYEKLFPPTKKVTAICIVRVFSDQSEYFQYGGPYGSAGYWNSQKEELVLFEGFDDMSTSKSNESTKSVMYHEAFHQYIHYAVSDLAPHSWFNEGHGDFFAGAHVRGSRVSFRPFDWRVDYLKRHLQQGKGLIPIRSLVRLPQGEYYSNAGLKYSEGWALIYYLRHVTKNKWWKQIPDRYFSHLRDNIAAFKKSKEDKDDTGGESIPGIPGVKVYSFEDAEKVDKILDAAVDKGFEGVNYEELDEAFRKWVKSIT